MLARLVVCIRCQQPQTLAGPVGNTMDCRSGHANPMTEAFLQTAGVFSQLELAVIRARVRSGMANASDNARMRQILQRTKNRKALVCKENPQSIEIAGFLFVCFHYTIDERRNSCFQNNGAQRSIKSILFVQFQKLRTMIISRH